MASNYLPLYHPANYCVKCGKPPEYITTLYHRTPPQDTNEFVDGIRVMTPGYDYLSCCCTGCGYRWDAQGADQGARV
jgi:hypothetical protein